ncbi:RagB/SusD family nutrient uptake outer membrane protein [Chitinophaga sp. SYP-B3965]|uniref:RagB/SusD family nutrient uptake outer membrane protein n=1 Tax=Chitinophaga sp. SYP-B3965 TaxID=2663120 RepID=UPI001299AFC5|nr:RagB/SusD family nutrient uptake outer membrane protein [Chitinophaga sp. SYP-B3965]MRG43566.1 RagB/SusD family nutrient uptake outer membrane protein [Chitinophaga sp. SYP-B3965]
MKRTILPALMSVLLFSGCNKWLDVKPSAQSNDTQIFGDADGVKTAVNGLYQGISTGDLYGRELTWGLNSALGQDYNVTKIRNEHVQVTNLAFTNSALVPVISGIWANSFNVIANCNKIIGEVKGKEDAFFPQGLTEKNLILGEAIAIRALMHFEMLRLFAPAPLNDRAGRYMPYQSVYPTRFSPALSTTEIIQRITADLDTAQQLVSANDTILNKNAMSGGLNALLSGSVSANGGLFFSYRMNRLNFVAIHALMARVYLYAGDRVNAKKEAEFVYRGYGPAGRNKWFAFTSEVNSKGPNRYIKLADDILFAAYDPNLAPAIRTYKNTITNPSVMYAIADVPAWFPPTERDYRANIIAADNSSDKWIELTGTTGNNIIPQNFIMPVVRLSEMYYIYSECLYEEGSTSDALKILNEIRIARGKTTNFTDASREGFYTELFNEYRKEFIAEGQTIFAYKRLKRPMMIGTKRIEIDNRFVLPLPDGEINF